MLESVRRGVFIPAGMKIPPVMQPHGNDFISL
jgi:hypothetical protein